MRDGANRTQAADIALIQALLGHIKHHHRGVVERLARETQKSVGFTEIHAALVKARFAVEAAADFGVSLRNILRVFPVTALDLVFQQNSVFSL